MLKPIETIKVKDWSLNLEDESYAEQTEELIKDAVDGVRITAPGCFVNLVTHQAAGHPENGLIDRLTDAIANADIQIQQIIYMDECGCGGYVTRVYR